MKKDISYPKLVLFLLISFICAFIFLPYALGTQAFIVGWDMRTIYMSNFENLRTVLQDWLHNGNLPFWTWFSFLGNDFYSSKLFYFNDYFEIPFALTDMKYDHAIMIMSYIKYLIAGFGFYAYAKYNHYSSRTSILGSLMFTFCAYLLYVMPHPFFSSFYVFLPLYFLSVDRYIVEKKFGFFIFMVFFLFTNNYYIFYSVSLFTILYFIYRWEKEYHNYKNMMKEAFKLIGYYIVGFLLSGIVVLPEALNILGNTRVGKRSSTLLYESLLPYFDYLFGLFVPASALANRGTPVSSLYTYVTKNDSVMQAYLWASSIVALLFPQLFTKKNRNPLHIFFIVLISVFALVPILSSILHGFSEPSFRWLASVVFFLIVLILPFLEDKERIHFPLLKKTIVCVSVISLLATPILQLLSGKSLSDLQGDFYLCILFLPTLLCIGYALYQKKERLLLCGLVIELAFVSFMSFYGSPDLRNVSKEDYKRWSTLLGEKNEYTNFTKTLSEENSHQFYRNYIDPETLQ